MPIINTVSARLLQVRAQLPYLSRTFGLIWAAAPSWTVGWAALLILQGLLPAAVVSLTRSVIDSLARVVGSHAGWAGIQPTLLLGLAMAVALVLSELAGNAGSWVRNAQSELVQDYIAGLIQEKATQVDLAFYEASEYYDHLYRAATEAGGRSLSLLESTGNMLQNGITLVAMGALLLSYAWWLPLVLFLSTLPALYVALVYNRRYRAWWKKTTADQRWAQHFHLVLTHPEPAAEVRLFDLGPYFRAAYGTIRARLRGERLRMNRDQALRSLAASASALLAAGVTVAWFFWRALQGFFTLGDLALLYQAFSRGQGLMRTLLTSMAQMYTNSQFLGDLFEFLALEPEVTDPVSQAAPPPVLQRELSLHNVTFRYPGAERAVLCDFDLSFPAGKVIAIVGPNGAGKSTLVKLLCRFYDPEAGSVDLDGEDIRHFRLADYRRIITYLGQNIVPYRATARDNIVFGDLSLRPEQAAIESAARSAGAHEVITRLPHGYDTMLGKWFDEAGAELSMGEWQRVALARAYIRRAQVILLDEPTSFMDSWAEAEWFERLRALAGGRRTTVMITHRFTIAMRADLIHVMDAGRIVESGTHAELVGRGGPYATSWAAQMAAARVGVLE